MASNIFLDANIILDYVLKRPEGYQDAKTIFERIVYDEDRGFTSAVAIHIVAHICKKILGADQARKIILALLNDMAVLDTGRDVIIQAMSAEWNDIEDALQYYTALNSRLNVFVTRDEGLLKKALPSLPILRPSEFLQQFPLGVF